MKQKNEAKKYNFVDLVNIEEVRKLFKRFYQSNGLTNALLDTDNNVLVAFGWQDICTKFHRVNKASCKRCGESDSYIAEHLNKGKFLEYKCKNGLWDASYPIMVEGQHLATVFVGQFFYEGESPDREFFVKQAEKYGFDKDAYLKALDKVPYFSRDFIQKTMKLYGGIATMLSVQGLTELKLREEINWHERHEVELKRVRQRLDLAVEKSKLGLWEMDLATGTEWCSGGFYDIFGYREGEVDPTFENLMDRIYPEDKDRVTEGVRVIQEKHIPYSTEYRIITKTGQVRWVRSWGRCDYDEEGKAVRMSGALMDITEEVEAEEAREKAEYRFRQLYESSFDGIVYCDLERNITDCNKAYADILGYRREELAGCNIKDLTQEIWHEKEQYIINERTMKHGYSGVYEKEYVKKDGTVVPVELSVHLVRGEDGKSQGMWGIVRDITERKRREEELRERERLLSAVEKISRIGGWEMDMTSGGKATWTKGTYSIVELDEEQPVPGFEEHIDWYLPEYRKYVRKKMEQFLADKKPLYYEAPIKTKKGNIKWGRAIGEVVEKNGEVVKLRGTFQDITDQKAAEEKLESAAKFPSENPNPVLRIAKDGNLLEANPASEDILEKWNTGIGRQVPDIWKKHIKNSFNSQLDNKDEIIENVNGSDYSFIIAPIVGSGYVNVYGRNVTERRKAEKELAEYHDRLESMVKNRTLELALKVEALDERETQLKKEVEIRRRREEEVRRFSVKLQEVNAELEAFSYSVSHDLRAPLRSMDGFSQAVLEDYQDKLDEKGKDYLMRIRHGSQRMAQLIDDILQLSRVTRYEVKKSVVDLSKKARVILQELSLSEPDRKVKVIIKPGIKVRADENLITIALSNLLANSWKFTGKTKQAKIEVDVIREKGKNIYVIRDNGSGFDMKYEDKLFRAFQRLHSEKDFPGTGIGLVVVKRVIVKHGGEIWVESKPGKGTVVYFTMSEK